MTPEERRLAALLADLGERHRAVHTDGSWLDGRLRRARRRRTALAAAASVLAVIAVAGGVTAATRNAARTAAPVPAATSTGEPTDSPSPAPQPPAFVSAIALRPDGTGAAVVGTCLADVSPCRQLLRLTSDRGRTLDPGTERVLPEGAHAPDVRRVSVAGQHSVYVWGNGLAYSNDDGATWTSRDQLAGQLVDLDVAPDSDSVWIATMDCPARPGADGCALGLRGGKAGQDPASFATLPLPTSHAGGAVVVSRAAGGRAAVAVRQPVGAAQLLPDAIFTSADDGSTWTREAAPCQGPDGAGPYSTADISTTQTGAVWVLCTQEGSAGLQRKRVFVSSGTGQPFRPAALLPDRGYAASIAASSASTAYVSASRGEVSATADGGHSWVPVTDNSDFFGPVQVLLDGRGVAPGQADGAGAVWSGTGTSRWTAYSVARSTRPPPPLPSPGPCERSKLAISASPAAGGAGGESGVLLAITNIGPGPCVLDGYPELTLLDLRGKPLAFSIEHTGSQTITAGPAGEVTVPVGGLAYVAFGKYRCDLGDKALAAAVDVTLPGRAFPLQVPLPATPSRLGYCGPGDPGSRIVVSPVEPDQVSTTRQSAGQPTTFDPTCSDRPIRPSYVALACADGSSIAESLTWTSWGQTEATAEGVLSENDCTPQCVSGTKHSYPATFHFSGNSNGHFAVVEIVFRDSGPHHERRQTRSL
ncbi:MAG: Uncharacterized protein JWP11_857 [Frankiales bacterium]|nr:Uncharacterized protein [Frankiales bacterium]